MRRILADYGGPWGVRTVYNRGGVGYLRRMIDGFNNAANGVPFLVLADLDQAECAPEVLRLWLPHGTSANMNLRFAVREVEAWLLADAQSLGRFFGINASLVPADVESLADPKQQLVKLARHSKKKDVQADLVPKPGSTAVVGRNYNARLAEFTAVHWQPESARIASPSLDRGLTSVEHFVPSWSRPT